VGVRALLAAHPFLDADRVGALGASYGGYMVNMLNGNNEDGMFKVRLSARACVRVCVCACVRVCACVCSLCCHSYSNGIFHPCPLPLFLPSSPPTPPVPPRPPARTNM
jgi:hypothetical protein